ncbi:hypothetical protein CK203_086933 [Vitis vinifera]|uniref:Uncharacterized protein n=1 Tax=Vitis vinifera TaxID=29760 RepID=A0A438FKA0_VITVI|nr:hypothetical protein CK203_086933 [Vitis vinifera]
MRSGSGSGIIGVPRSARRGEDHVPVGQTSIKTHVPLNSLSLHVRHRSKALRNLSDSEIDWASPTKIQFPHAKSLLPLSDPSLFSVSINGHCSCSFILPCCQGEGFCCSTSCRAISCWNRSFDGRLVPNLTGARKQIFGSTQFQWLPAGRDYCLSKVQVAADYSDSVPDSPKYMGNQGYHPLEELKESKRIQEKRLTAAEVARTTVEV